MKTKLLLLVILATSLFAKYNNCTFKNKHYEDICKKVVKHGVSYEYANRFLLSYFKTQKYDEITWKYIQPSKLKYHKEKEKQANNVLVKFVPEMVKNLKQYKEIYDYAQKKYSVNREIIAAILLKETKLGKIKPIHDAFIVFNTIVTRIKPDTNRNKWLLKMGTTNMASIIEYCYRQEVSPEQCNLPSSYAGAVGIPQFMPNSFIYADSYKREVADLTNMEDAIVSVAKFLHVKAKFTTPIDWKKMPNIPAVEKEWYDYAYRYDNALFCCKKNKHSTKKYRCFTKGKPHLNYMKLYIKKIMRYNNSSNYAVGVLRLAYDAHLFLKKNNN